MPTRNGKKQMKIVKHSFKKKCVQKRCEHGKQKRYCQLCGGCAICKHGKHKPSCKICVGSAVCDHERLKHYCKLCSGSGICKHNKQRSKCKDCVGASICEHNRQRQQCPDCGGTSICKSRREPYNTGCRTKGNSRYDGFCTHCFINLFPNDPRALTVRKKSKEMKEITHLLSIYDGFIHDKTFYVDLQGVCCATK